MGLMSYAGKMALGGGAKALKGAMMGPGIAEMKAGLGLGMGVGGMGAIGAGSALGATREEEVARMEAMNEEIRRMLEEQRMERRGIVPPQRFGGR